MHLVLPKTPGLAGTHGIRTALAKAKTMESEQRLEEALGYVGTEAIRMADDVGGHDLAVTKGASGVEQDLAC